MHGSFSTIKATAYGSSIVPGVFFFLKFSQSYPLGNLFSSQVLVYHCAARGDKSSHLWTEKYSSERIRRVGALLHRSWRRDDDSCEGGVCREGEDVSSG